MSFLDLLVFIVFAVGVVLIGLVKSRGEDTHRPQGASDYFLAGRGLAWWLAGFSLIAANISTEQFVGMSGQAADWRIAMRSRSPCDHERIGEDPHLLPLSEHLAQAVIPRGNRLHTGAVVAVEAEFVGPRPRRPHVPSKAARRGIGSIFRPSKDALGTFGGFRLDWRLSSPTEGKPWKLTSPL